MQTKFLGTICTCVLVGILVAGLWPCHAPRNDVSWLSSGSGLFFGKHGSIVSAGAFEHNQLRADGFCSVELWLEPNRVNSAGTILVFYSPTSQFSSVALRQSLGDLKLEQRSHGQSAKKTRIYVDDVFSRLQPLFVTISSGKKGTAIYLDGKLVRTVPSLRLSTRDLTGQLIIGGAPLTNNAWSGQVKRLAVYDRELPAAEVSQHFADWTTGDQPNLTNTEGIVASYLFNEGKGRVVHNQVDSATDLIIPERFFVLNKQLLERPWNEFRTDWNYFEDVAINIGGFIPLGFFFRAYFSGIGKFKRAIWITIALGFVVSLTIEVLQAFLPTRDSGMTDLITNTFGTALGAILSAWSMKHNWVAHAILTPAAGDYALIAESVVHE